MYHFDAIIHARGSGVGAGERVSLGGCSVASLRFDSSGGGEPMPVSFEQAAESLGCLPRMFVEPDGSFVWVGDNPARWQVDGVMYDRGGRVLFVQIRGSCPAERFDDFLRAFAWPDGPLLFQLPRHAVFLDEAAFRQVAARPAPPATSRS